MTSATTTSRRRSKSGGPTPSQAIAEARGIRVSVITAEGGSALERLASLVAVPDFTSIYLAMAHGLDPMAVPGGRGDEGPVTAVRARCSTSAPRP